jgi:predicted amidohydrolase
MKVAAVQFNPLFGDIERNISKAMELLSGVDSDLFVLPEFCFTGYTFQSRREAESLAENPADGYSIARMKELARAKNCAVVFGFCERAREGLYNSAAFVSPIGEIRIYRKLHLFLNEKDWFLSGDRPPQVHEFRGCRLGVMICFDWIYPEVARTLALQGANVICHPANLVMPYCQAAMVTRCLENRVFSITANRIGEEVRGGFHNMFTGRSQIVSPKGNILFRASENKEEVCLADINYRESEDKAVNSKNNLWSDRRPEYY